MLGVRNRIRNRDSHLLWPALCTLASRWRGAGRRHVRAVNGVMEVSGVVRMPRVARVVVAGMAHHVTQRGNNRQDILFTDDDRRFCIDTLREQMAGLPAFQWVEAPQPDGLALGPPGAFRGGARGRGNPRHLRRDQGETQDPSPLGSPLPPRRTQGPSPIRDAHSTMTRA